jgi:membrane protease YdiL (CAAX protease family)
MAGTSSSDPGEISASGRLFVGTKEKAPQDSGTRELSPWRRVRYFLEGTLVGLSPLLIRVPENWRPSDPIKGNLFQILVMWSWLAFGFAILKLQGRRLSDIGIRFKRNNLLRTVGLGLLLAVGIFGASQLRDYIGAKADLSWLYPLRGNLPLTLSTMALGFLGAGVTEEFICRGVCMHSFARALGERPWSWILAAILQAGLFSIPHIYMGFYGVIWAFVMALVLAAAFFAFKRNLLPLMIGHGIHNIFKMVLFYFGVAM